MGNMVYSSLWVMSELYHQPYFKALWGRRPYYVKLLGYFDAQGMGLERPSRFQLQVKRGAVVGFYRGICS